jgi:hypothetical protein
VTREKRYQKGSHSHGRTVTGYGNGTVTNGAVNDECMQLTVNGKGETNKNWGEGGERDQEEK